MLTFERQPTDMHTKCHILSGYYIATFARRVPPIGSDVSEVATAVSLNTSTAVAFPT
jgi:hypothetical protein